MHNFFVINLFFVLSINESEPHPISINEEVLLILFKKTRFYAAWGLIITLAAVFPANIYLAQTNGFAMDTTPAIAWYRLPFQSLFIVLAYWHRK